MYMCVRVYTSLLWNHFCRLPNIPAVYTVVQWDVGCGSSLKHQGARHMYATALYFDSVLMFHYRRLNRNHTLMYQCFSPLTKDILKYAYQILVVVLGCWRGTSALTFGSKKCTLERAQRDICPYESKTLKMHISFA